MKALVLGATGATGKEIVAQLLHDPLFSEVHVFVRRNAFPPSDKLKVHVVDFDKPDSWSNLVVGDVAFSALGTTLRAAGSKDKQRRIDVDFQVQFARAARAGGVHSFCLLSSMGASSSASAFYLRLKGEAEDQIRSLGFGQLFIFRPGLLDRGEASRPMERLSLGIVKLLNAVGLFRSYRAISTTDLAAKMIKIASRAEGPEGAVTVLGIKEIATL